MGTSYYFKFKNISVDLNAPLISEDLKNKILSKLQSCLDEELKIRIGKRSGGWNPLFQKSKYYSSVKEIRDFYSANKDSVIITDEYERIMSFEELEENLINWSKDNASALKHEGEYFCKDSEGYEFID